MKKLLLAVIILMLLGFISCDDTADSPELSSSEAVNANSTLFSSVYTIYDTEINGDEKTYTSEDSTAHPSYIFSGSKSSTAFDITITFDTYNAGSLDIIEGTTNMKGNIVNGKLDGTMTSRIKFEQADGDRYWFEWNLTIEQNVYSGTYKTDDVTYDFPTQTYNRSVVFDY
jgi:hypothetical protein